MSNELNFGDGRIHVEAICDRNRSGIMLRRTDEPHLVGEFASDAPAEYQSRDGDTVLWFDNLESLRIVQDELARIALIMQHVLHWSGDHRVS